MQKKKIGLALQGGGSHGAFTWGILEKLLETDLFEICGITGTSAGAMNAAITIAGFENGGGKGAIELLEKFWKNISETSRYSALQPSWLDNKLFSGGLEFSPGYQLFNAFSNFVSPYQFNPLDVNPLRSILVDLIDFNVLNQSPISLFVSATNVKTSKPKIFRSPDITLNTLMASACLPLLFKSVEINGDYYWDGGYLGNPSLSPLINFTDTIDILLCKVNPIEINFIPKKAHEIQDRINDISFNSGLMNEMRTIYYHNKLLRMGVSIDNHPREIFMHEIAADQKLQEYSYSSKFNTTWIFLNNLRMKGRESAEKWIQHHYEKVNHESTLDVEKVYL